MKSVLTFLHLYLYPFRTYYQFIQNVFDLYPFTLNTHKAMYLVISVKQLAQENMTRHRC